MTANLIQSPDRVILPNISWPTYQSLIKDFDLTSSSLDRLSIYAALGIPEVMKTSDRLYQLRYHCSKPLYKEV